MKRILLLLTLLLFVFLGACSNKDAITPNDRFGEYVKLWNNQKFDKMYSYLADDTKKKFPTDKVVDRYKKIYEDLGIHDLKVSFKN
ncbi:NTF2-like N-terminal transpeptidase domain-containing protein [Virgibacillus sp. 179-BFC.A HS]|uniref:NTF2-like N-terminal transpeptidase domain-containing protein n=1 Tax=Tigheibacillus jepli TaxID=3035914 RepID=A0ABU5CGF2_9BACI|nr:NTF2-like N-terminal transpeptidase domain-containing protein [Virgibacillus sp. 179-BFC.A HS]MDY0405071.1 NTF2-like N-terminal transpeptidase domain-containing protein [Virgibacillus sp. 179-BFC.A HS]